MASEASRKKAEGFVDGIAGDVSDIYGSDGRGHWIESLAAALDEARAEGRAEALGDAIPLKDLMAEALAAARAEGERIGAERERWECHRIANATVSSGNGLGHTCWRTIASRIRGRGPMRGPEEE